MKVCKLILMSLCFSLLGWYNKLGIVHCTYLGVSGYNLKKKSCILFTFTNSVDPDEMQHYAAFHLGLHCLQKYLFRGFPKGWILCSKISIIILHNWCISKCISFFHVLRMIDFLKKYKNLIAFLYQKEIICLHYGRFFETLIRKQARQIHVKDMLYHDRMKRHFFSQ